MYAFFSKSLTNGKVTFYIDESDDILKAKLADDPDVETELIDRHFGWEYLRSGTILKGEDNLYQLWDETNHDNKVDLFQGEVVFLSEIDPIFD